MSWPRCFHFLLALAFFTTASIAEGQTVFTQPHAPAMHIAALLSTLPPPAPISSAEAHADVLMARGEYQAAIRAYDAVENPDTAVWDKKGIAYQMLYNLDGAKRCYKQAIKLDPSNVRALNNLATLFDSLKQFSKAERAYEQALKVDPRSAMLLRNFGTSLIMHHQYGRGSDLYAEALAIDPHILDQAPGYRVYATSAIRDCGDENYFQARSCARAGLADCALTHLRKAFSQGAATLARVAGEGDFDLLRPRPAFQNLLAEQK